jgi:hypothetical protein
LRSRRRLILARKRRVWDEKSSCEESHTQQARHLL